MREKRNDLKMKFIRVAGSLSRLFFAPAFKATVSRRRKIDRHIEVGMRARTPPRAAAEHDHARQSRLGGEVVDQMLEPLALQRGEMCGEGVARGCHGIILRQQPGGRP